MIDLRFIDPIDTKPGHFGDVLPSRSLRLLLKKVNPTQHSQQAPVNLKTGVKHCNENKTLKRFKNVKINFKRLAKCLTKTLPILCLSHMLNISQDSHP